MEYLLACAQHPSWHTFILQEMQKELQGQQSNISSTQENLNSLCRQYHSAELERLGGALTGLTRRHEAVHQLCSRTQASLQDSLEQHFHGELGRPFAGTVCLRERIPTKCGIESASEPLHNFLEGDPGEAICALRLGSRSVMLGLSPGAEFFLFPPGKAGVHPFDDSELHLDF